MSIKGKLSRLLVDIVRYCWYIDLLRLADRYVFFLSKIAV